MSGIREGTVTVVSRHTTTGVTINEWESRLVRDIKTWLLELAPPDRRSAVGAADGPEYFHNDINQRPDSIAETQRWGRGSTESYVLTFVLCTTASLFAH